MHFYPAPLLSCRLEGLELSVSSPWSSRNTQFQLSGSAALIIIWPHLFGRLRESWFPSRILRAIGFIPLPFLSRRLFCDKPPLKPPPLKLLWTGAMFFSHKSLPINIKSWQWVAPLFSLPSPDKEHPPKHTATTHLKVTLTWWQAADLCEYGQKQKQTLRLFIAKLARKVYLKAVYVKQNFHEIMIRSRRCYFYFLWFIHRGISENMCTAARPEVGYLCSYT